MPKSPQNWEIFYNSFIIMRGDKGETEKLKYYKRFITTGGEKPYEKWGENPLKTRIENNRETIGKLTINSRIITHL